MTKHSSGVGEEDFFENTFYIFQRAFQTKLERI